MAEVVEQLGSARLDGWQRSGGETDGHDDRTLPLTQTELPAPA